VQGNKGCGDTFIKKLLKRTLGRIKAKGINAFGL